MDELSQRERDVLDLLCQGKRNREIAAELFVGPETVKSHLKTIYRKLDVRSRTEAAFVARSVFHPPAAESWTDSEITVTGTAGRVRVVVGGEVDMVSAPKLQAALLEVLEREEAVEVDLADVSFIDSSGLRALVEASTHGRVVIVSTSPRVARLLAATGLEAAFGLPANPA